MEYADIFALNLDEVQPVDWHSQNLDIDPSTKLPKHRVDQQPVTAVQKEFLFGMLDDMEKAHIIQKIPADKIKCLNSTNLAPKEAKRA